MLNEVIIDFYILTRSLIAFNKWYYFFSPKILIMAVTDFWFIKNKSFRNQTTLFWLTLSLLFSLFYSYLAIQQAFTSEYVIQDDARQHIFWMLRFNDSQLFPNNLIADYFQSVAPAGYKFLYWIINKLGIDPITLSKLLPSVLGLVTTGYCFVLTLEIR